MSELPPDEPSMAAAGADPSTRTAAAYEVHGANTNHEAPGDRYPLSGGSRFRGGHDVDIYPFDSDEGPLVAEGKSRRPDGASLLRCHGEVVNASRHDPGHSRVVA
jgi:hypothetical protein